jgi:hypothetical protein
VNSRLVDFHSHFYDRAWFSSPTISGQGILARAWPMLTDIEAQLAAMDSAKIDAKVLSAPSALLVEPGKHLPLSLMERINDRFAELVSTYLDRLLALATIDAFQGEVAAHEVERAIQKLGLGQTTIRMWYKRGLLPGTYDRQKNRYYVSFLAIVHMFIEDFQYIQAMRKREKEVIREELKSKGYSVVHVIRSFGQVYYFVRDDEEDRDIAAISGRTTLSGGGLIH